MGFSIYGERRTQISLSSPATISPLARIEDRQGIKINTDIKIANYIKSNHKMVSFTDHYNAISIGRLPSRTKIGKVSWNFNNSVLCKPEFSSSTKTFLFLLKNKKNNHSSASDRSEYAKSRFIKNTNIFSKNCITQENITISKQNLLFLLKTQKTTTIQQLTDWETLNPVSKKMLKLFLKSPLLKKILTKFLTERIYLMNT